MKKSAVLLLILPIGLLISLWTVQGQFFFQIESNLPFYMGISILVLFSFVAFVQFVKYLFTDLFRYPSSEEPIRVLTIFFLQISIIYVLRKHWFEINEMGLEVLPTLQLVLLLGGLLLNAWWFKGASIVQIWTGLEKAYFSTLILTNILAIALVWKNFLNIYISLIVIGYLAIRVIALQKHPRIRIVPRKIEKQ